MDPTTMYDAAVALWPLIGTGAAERLGAAGTEQGLRLLDQVRAGRRERGLGEIPATVEELAKELSLLPTSSQQAIKVVATVFNDRVVFDNSSVHFGFGSAE